MIPSISSSNSILRPKKPAEKEGIPRKNGGEFIKGCVWVVQFSKKIRDLFLVFFFCVDETDVRKERQPALVWERDDCVVV